MLIGDGPFSVPLCIRSIKVNFQSFVHPDGSIRNKPTLISVESHHKQATGLRKWEVTVFVTPWTVYCEFGGGSPVPARLLFGSFEWGQLVQVSISKDSKA